MPTFTAAHCKMDPMMADGEHSNNESVWKCFIYVEYMRRSKQKMVVLTQNGSNSNSFEPQTIVGKPRQTARQWRISLLYRRSRASLFSQMEQALELPHIRRLTLPKHIQCLANRKTFMKPYHQRHHLRRLSRTLLPLALSQIRHRSTFPVTIPEISRRLALHSRLGRVRLVAAEGL